MSYILSLIKNRKLVIGIVVVGLLGISAYLGWNRLESSIYQEGYSAAVIEYQGKLQKAQKEYNREIEYKLTQQRTLLAQRHKNEMRRLEAESVVDKEVQTVTEYIEEKIYVKEECDIVPPDLNRMFNNSIDSINGSK
ncbi:hypothetical protein HWD03_gp031 [Alteromonas phage vB_AmeM_PT11-V22]|uniref:Uncharacterized protein n=1 Tax=Alteromonas phage vB_AmeM_PT11-V22 TaxID=2704031 RepID=A0A6C0R2M2_9CAUD|nr:hypothetical protein HWD03_gp031 [Alteromonas phage vB_AmeM_PT11-V22]QHZ59754.1 hypothetical protein [Alteromonas phage vB_AmeM_PT11-V22]